MPDAAAATAPTTIRWPRVLPWALMLVGLIVFVNSLEGPFVFDDQHHILDDPNIRPPLRLVELWRGTNRPLVALSLALNYAIDETQVAGYHLFNIGVHIAAGLTLFGIVRRTLGVAACAAPFRQDAPWVAFAIALLWLVHPLVTQAVSYTIQRSESMMGLLLLLTLYATLRSAEPGRHAAWQAVAVLACALGMLAKEGMAVAPLVVLVFDRTLLAGSFGAALRRRPWLYGGLAATWLLLALVLRGGAALLEPGSAGFGVTSTAMWPYLLTQAQVLCHYLRLALWPHPLVFDYAWPPATGIAAVWPYALGILALAAATVWALARRHGLGVLGAWFFLILAPTSSIMPIADLAVEHRMYLPLAAVVAAAVLGTWGLLGRLSDPSQRRTAGAVLLGLAACVLSALTIGRNAEYRTAASLWQSVVDRVGHQNPRAYQSLGLAQLHEGRLLEARKTFDIAIELVPDSADAYHDRGVTAFELADLDGALSDLQHALSLDPDRASTHYNLAQVFFRQGRLDEAGDALEKSIQLKPDHANAFNLLGRVRLDQGRPEDAVAAARRFVELAPRRIDGQTNLGYALFEAGQWEEGLDAYRRAYELDGANPMVVLRLAKALDRTGRPAEAIPLYERAIRAQRDDARFEALCRLATLRATWPDAAFRDGAEAVLLARQANALARAAESHDALASALAEAGQFDEAVRAAEQALALAAEQHMSVATVEAMKQRLELFRQGKPFRRADGAPNPVPGED